MRVSNNSKQFIHGFVVVGNGNSNGNGSDGDFQISASFDDLSESKPFGCAGADAFRSCNLAAIMKIFRNSCP